MKMENQNELHLKIGTLKIELEETKNQRDFWIRNYETLETKAKEQQKEIERLKTQL